MSNSEILPIVQEKINEKILEIRGQRVMIDRDLAMLYGVETKQLKRAVRRNISRFPEDFMFELTSKEEKNLKSQFGTSSWGGSRYKSMVFTEQGVAMLPSVLNSEKAIQVNIAIMRIFVQIKEIIPNYIKVQIIPNQSQMSKLKISNFDAVVLFDI